ncbi:hypothetical protein B0H19DRAFT_1366524 [Mycena capillaripes]|nr:hypothetical protein B0H19DRAFT_1366524 [Mycena capillaripes]
MPPLTRVDIPVALPRYPSRHDLMATSPRLLLPSRIASPPPSQTYTLKQLSLSISLQVQSTFFRSSEGFRVSGFHLQDVRVWVLCYSSSRLKTSRCWSILAASLSLSGPSLLFPFPMCMSSHFTAYTLYIPDFRATRLLSMFTAEVEIASSPAECWEV